MDSFTAEQKKMGNAFEKWWTNTEPLRKIASPNLHKADARAYFSFGWIACVEEEAGVDASADILKELGGTLGEL